MDSEIQVKDIQLDQAVENETSVVVEAGVPLQDAGGSDPKDGQQKRGFSDGDGGYVKKQKRIREAWDEKAEARILDESGNPLYNDPRRPKKKVACLIGYCGTGYHGMQLNPGTKTIEYELFEAFVKTGAISRDNSNDLKKSSFMRAARTDKGVHAAGNVVSLKMIVEDDNLLEKLNAELPDQIRVWGIERVNKSFDCRKMCSSRVYEYLMPSFCLLPPKPTSPLGKHLAETLNANPDSLREDKEGVEWWEEYNRVLGERGISAEDVEKVLEATINSELATDETDALGKQIRRIGTELRRNYRCTPERLAVFRDALKLYEGSHNFHNFTLGKHFKDPSGTRFMKDLTVSEPFVIEGTEWVSIKIHGQSFMLHQIRKMVGLAALVARTGASLDRITDSFTNIKLNIPKAPALGLLLEQPVYEAINTRLEKFGYKHVDFAPYETEMLEFKKSFIYDKIYAEEIKENVFYGFFSFIDGFVGNDGFKGIKMFDFLTGNFSKVNNGEKEVKEAKKKTQPAETVAATEEATKVTETEPLEAKPATE
ncbi:unnamed protein product [Kuraishia capsulata CBS 1993]|uniref:tRNA pseudouridine synthase 1 n=1 Tax=Kuraishia capsulata CBS 1993 TaxID=1382522 RepID=W6MM72_9ASCO|nr:uncharacterized protein KUCA_T00003633001 [Kuraishia capsulata CBS 1993]CDK27654.1 unnamed protein product [Kuraishia capsulata CBS 1993]